MVQVVSRTPTQAVQDHVLPLPLLVRTVLGLVVAAFAVRWSFEAVTVLAEPASSSGLFGDAQTWRVVNLILWPGALLLLALLLRYSVGDSAPMPIRWRETSDSSLVCIALAALGGLTFWPLIHAVESGSSGLLVLCLLALAPVLAATRRDIWAGVALALAAFLGISAVVLILSYVARRRWRVVLGSALALPALLATAALSRGGIAAFAARAVQGVLPQVGHFQNESLAQVPLWLTIIAGHSPSRSATLAGEVIAALVVIATSAGFAVLAFRSRTYTRVLAGDLPTYGWALATMLLLMPVAFAEQYIFALPVLAVGVGGSIQLRRSIGEKDNGHSRPPSLRALGLLAAAYALMAVALPFAYDIDAGARFGPMVLQITHVPLRPFFMLLRPLGALCLWAALAALSFGASTRGRPDSARALAPFPGDRHEASAGLLCRALLVALIVGAAAQWTADALALLAAPTYQVDFSIYYAAALALSHNLHADIYSLAVRQAAAKAHAGAYIPVLPYLYPPLLAILLLPLAWARYGLAVLSWTVLNLALCLAGTCLLASVLSHALDKADASLTADHDLAYGAARTRTTRTAPMSSSDTAWFTVGIAAFVTLLDDPLNQGVLLGQISVAIYFLVTLTLWLVVRGRQAWGGSALALAAMLKVLPLVLIMYYALTGRWRVVAGSLIGFAALLGGMALVVGWPSVLAARVILTQGADVQEHFNNQALSDVPFWVAAACGVHSTVLTGFLGRALLVVVALAWVAILGAAWLLRRRAGSKAGDAHADALGYCLSVCTMILVFPLTWQHYDAWLLAPFAYCLGAMLVGLGRHDHTSGRRAVRDVMLVGALIAGYVLTMNSLPFKYDLAATFSTGPRLFGLAVRPFFMLLRPLGAVLIWSVSAALFLRAARVNAQAR